MKILRKKRGNKRQIQEMKNDKKKVKIQNCKNQKMKLNNILIKINNQNQKLMNIKRKKRF